MSATMAACQDPDKVLGWLHAIPEASFVDLGNTGENKKLDAMLFQAVKDAKKVSELRQSIDRRAQDMLSEGNVLRGRQAVWMILVHYQTREQSSMASVIANLVKMMYPGDKQLRPWIEEWKTIYFTLARAMPNGFGFDPRDMLYKQLRKSEDLLRPDIAYFARLNPQDPDYSVEWLLGRVDYLLYEKVQDKNQEDLDRRFAKFSGEPKPPPTKSANAQGAKGDGKGRGKGKKAKGKGKNPGSTEDGPARPKPPCWNWQKGHCKLGKDCSFSHDGPKGKSTGGAAANEVPKTKGAPKKHPQAPPPRPSQRPRSRVRRIRRTGPRARASGSVLGLGPPPLLRTVVRCPSVRFARSPGDFASSLLLTPSLVRQGETVRSRTT